MPSLYYVSADVAVLVNVCDEIRCLECAKLMRQVSKVL